MVDDNFFLIFYFISSFSSDPVCKNNTMLAQHNCRVTLHTSFVEETQQPAGAVKLIMKIKLL